MAITLFNPTKDEFQATYGGVTFVIPPFSKDGHMIRVDDNKGNHILNQLGPRGLTSLEYGDEGEVKKKKADDGRRRNLDFKRTQIARYNRDNEARKSRQLAYVTPPKHINDWAEELGIGLITPYEIQDIKNEEISRLRADSEKRDQENLELRKQVAELMDAIKDLLPKKEKSADELIKDKYAEEIESMQGQIKRMNRNQFRPWVEELQQQKYGSYPLEIQQFIRDRWEGFFGKDEAAFPY